MATRRIKVRGTDQRLVLALGALTGVGLALRGLSPTGSTVVDWLLLVLVGSGVVWASASAPWWALSGMAGVAAAIAPPWVPLIIGVGVLLLSLGVGVIRRSQPVERAAVAGGAVLVLSMARELGWWGVSSLVAISLVVVVAGLGLWRRSSRERRWAMYAVGGAATVVAIGALGIFAAGTAARPDLSEGNRTARQGLRQLKSGEFELAQESFERAAAAFERADRDLGAVWAQPARLVPIASQHRHAAASLSGAAASATQTIQRQLRLVDLDSLQIVDGRIDVDAVRALEPPMRELQAAMDELEDAVVSARSGWLAEPVQDELDELQVDIDEQQILGEKAVAALEVAPAILGAEGERVYFVMFTTPAEARGQGGFMGNYAELTVTDGRIEMTAFGTDEDLNRAIEHPVRLERAPEDWLARYGPFGFQKGPDRVVGNVPWKNITMSPHFPSTAQVVAELYPKSGGVEIDGVISLDVFVLEALVGLVGPIEVPGTVEPLTVSTTAGFLLLDQYEISNPDERSDLLETVARDTVLLLLDSSPPPFVELGRALAPFVPQRRLMTWMAREGEQTVVRSAHADGGLLRGLGGRDGLAVTVTNAAGNKIENFLERSFTYESSIDPDAVRRLTIELANLAPSYGRADYVIGNRVGLPPGSSRLYLTLFTPSALQASEVDGIPTPMASGVEDGLFAYSMFLDIGAGQSATITVALELPVSAQADEVVIEPQPLVNPERWVVRTAQTVVADTVVRATKQIQLSAG